MSNNKETGEAPTSRVTSGKMGEHADQAKRQALLALLFASVTEGGGVDE